MQCTKLLYVLLLCATAQQSLTVKKQNSTVPAQTEAEKAQAAFDKLTGDYGQQPISAQDQQALQLIKKHPSLLTESNLQRAFSILFRKTALYIINHMPAYKGTISNFINVIISGDIAIFNVLFSRIPDTDKLVLDGSNLFEAFFDAIDSFNYSVFTTEEKQKAEARANHLKILQALVKAGADVNKPIGERWGSEPLSLAVRVGDKQIINYLISAGAKVNPPSNAPLIAAINAKNIDAIKLLIQKGADINQPVSNGSNKVYPLFIVLEDFSHRPQETPESITPVINTLLDMGADVNAKSKLGEREVTPLEEALLMQQSDIAKLLISRGAQINTQDTAGNTLLHRLLMEDPSDPSLIKTINLLLDFKPDPTIKNKLGKTALDLAREHTASADIIKRLEELAKK